MSTLYPSLLLTQAFLEVLQLDDQQRLGDLLMSDERHKLYVVLYQTSLRTLWAQKPNGSWNEGPEQTSHAICILANAWRLRVFHDLRPHIEVAITSGVKYLQHSGVILENNWTSKTVYSVDLVGRAYILAAFRMAKRLHLGAEIGLGRDSFIEPSKISAYMRLSQRLPLLACLPPWHLEASLTEAVLFLPLLRRQRDSIFNRNEKMFTSDDYVDVIPFTWIVCNNRTGVYASSYLTLNMMIISLYGYQVDEFMDGVASKLLNGHGGGLKTLIDALLEKTMLDDDHSHRESTRCADTYRRKIDTSVDTEHEAVLGIERFISYVLRHRSVTLAHPISRMELHRELRAFLHAHCDQMDENRRFQEQDTWEELETPAQTFFQYARTTGGDHVACAYSLSFMLCLLSSLLKRGGAVFETAEQRYLAAAAARHLTTACRIHNDYGSIARDREERNINGVHYPEFRQTSATGKTSLDAKKQALLFLGSHEHECLSRELHKLEDLLRDSSMREHETGKESCRVIAHYRYFCDVASLYNQIYVQKDLSSRIR